MSRKKAITDGTLFYPTHGGDTFVFTANTVIDEVEIRVVRISRLRRFLRRLRELLPIR